MNSEAERPVKRLTVNVAADLRDSLDEYFLLRSVPEPFPGDRNLAMLNIIAYIGERFIATQRDWHDEVTTAATCDAHSGTH